MGLLGFDVHVDEVEDSQLLCRVTGELDAFTAPQLDDALDEVHFTSQLVVDLSGVPFIDSAGLRALVGVVQRVRESGGNVAVCSHRPATNRAFELTGFDRMVCVAPTPQQAARHLSGN